MLDKAEIVKRVYGCERLSDFKETGRHIYAYDEEEGIHLYFKFLENINFDDLFDFGSQIVEKEKFFKVIAECLDKRLFLMPEKVYFINSEEELDGLLEEYECQFIDLENTIGINWHDNSVIVINMLLIKQLINEDIKDNQHLSYEKELNVAVWETIIHELRHMLCDSGLIVTEEEIPLEEGSEERVEEYCREVTFNEIVNAEYICFS